MKPPMKSMSEKSSELLERAQQILVGGVNSPVRAFRAVGGAPLMIERAAGARLRDVDGREFIDYVCSWGALITGHADADVVAAVTGQARRGTSYGMTSPLEIELGERIARAIPSIERVRFVSSGTEAAMSAIRAARAFTGRDLILKFEGCYHGHSGSFLAEAGSGLATLGISSSPGVPQALASLTLNAPYNDLPAAERVFREHAGKIAAVILEPVAANMGVVPPVEGFLSGLRELTRSDGALLIFDEVITGFRLCFGGAQNVFGIRPDVTILGKIIGGGLPVAAYGGRGDIMERIAPMGPVYQAGTLAGNPLAMRAGIAMLEKLAEPGFYQGLGRRADRLADGLRQALKRAQVAGQVAAAGSLLTLFFVPEPVRDYAAAKCSDLGRFRAFFHQMLDRGVFLPPSQFEAMFVSTAHTEADIDATIKAAGEALEAMSAG
ncbi:MAG TPA: glutamate-1-semialdehyde 2,1-aminomutase [Candidatus Acidoferrales bacterium]|nr:glutamate-1-semialdehyde 2,1-aminomutase [Candidatus Acidoferrales bacterium]